MWISLFRLAAKIGIICDMRFLARLVFPFFSNLTAMAAAVYFVRGFEIAPTLRSFVIVAAIFTVINVFVRPIIKLILSPLIILTLGLGIIAVNAAILYLLDFFSTDINISGLVPLIYATLIISVANFIIHFSAKKLYKE